MPKRRAGAILDPFLLMLLATAALGILLPARGAFVPAVAAIVALAIALLFFVYGLRLAPSAVGQGIRHWRLQAMVVVGTFVACPLIGLALTPLAHAILPAPLVTGLMFICVLPSTMQSSIAFTSIARGNVSAAFCSASVSSLLGIVVTPILVAVLLRAGGAFGFDALRGIALQLFLPFVVGQLLRPALGGTLDRFREITAVVDRASILVVVYAAFSEGTASGVWSRVTPGDLLAVAGFDAAILAAILGFSTMVCRRLGFSREDEIAIVFCGSKKSLAAGIPMANILFAGGAVSLILLPIMLFHQLQLFVCAIIARRYARETAPEAVAYRSGAAPAPDG